MERATHRSLSDEALQIAWIFQAVCAFPVLIILGFMAFEQLFYPYISLYDFVTDTINALMAAGVIFIAFIQRRLPNLGKMRTLQFETAKAILATAMWLWLLLDSLFGPWVNRYYGSPPLRRPRVIRSLISSILLFVLFYPTLAYAIYLWRRTRLSPQEERAVDEEPAGENTPLLRE